MLVLGWFLLGIALLAIEAGILSLGAPTGKYVSVVGALRVNLLGVTPIPFSTWPWAQESISGALQNAAGGEVLSLGTKLATGGIV